MTHRPYYNASTKHMGEGDHLLPILKTFYDAGGELVLVGHEHNYQHFIATNPYTNQPDPAKGFMQFVVGTGGTTGMYGDLTATQHNAQALVTKQSAKDWGLLKLTLKESSFAWDFVPIPGSNLADSGDSTCH